MMIHYIQSNILNEISEAIDATNDLKSFTITKQALQISGSVLSSVIAVILSPFVFAPAAFAGSFIIVSNLIKILNDIRYTKVLNKILFEDHSSFIDRYYQKLNDKINKNNKSQIKDLDIAFSKCVTRTTFFHNEDKEYYELRKCYIKYLDVKSQVLEIDNNDPDYIEFKRLIPRLLYLKEKK